MLRLSGVSREAETVLAYGGNAALREVRDQVPVTTRFLGYGHKLGIAMVGRAALDMQRGPTTARLAAHDMVRFEQQGCYSPHVVYVERGGAVTPRQFAQHLAAMIERRGGRVFLSSADAMEFVSQGRDAAFRYFSASRM